jgi:DNA-binding response OmpR family regulator
VARVLIIEDDQRLADTIGDLLSSSGHAVSVVYDGPDALSAAGESRPDVVLVDLVLPSFSGLEVARRIRAMFGRQLRLVAYTGWTEFLDHPMSKVTFDAVIVKPATLDQLLEIVGA